MIYRHQVLKQADVVLANFLRSDEFAADVQRRNFDYYDAITTGDSSLSACVQAIMAAEVGHADLARHYFDESLYLDIADTHGNTVDGAHIANVGGVWAGLVHGFAGVRDTGAPRPRRSPPARRLDARCGSGCTGAAATSRSRSIRTGRPSRSSRAVPVPIMAGGTVTNVAAGESVRVRRSRTERPGSERSDDR